MHKREGTCKLVESSVQGNLTRDLKRCFRWGAPVMRDAKGVKQGYQHLISDHLPCICSAAQLLLHRTCQKATPSNIQAVCLDTCTSPRRLFLFAGLPPLCSLHCVLLAECAPGLWRPGYESILGPAWQGPRRCSSTRNLLHMRDYALEFQIITVLYAVKTISFEPGRVQHLLVILARALC